MSGDHPAAASGGPQSFTLDPATDFSLGEPCTVTIYAAQVSDQDSDGPQRAIRDLVNGLNAASTPGTYALITDSAPGTDQIKVAMIYKPAVVTPVGAGTTRSSSSLSSRAPSSRR